MSNPVHGPIAFIIPAYHPAGALLDLVRNLARRVSGPIIVVDDGSGPAYREIFEDVRLTRGVSLLRHAVNLGKGAALKTGFNHALCEYPDLLGAITVDADGQHSVDDVLAVADALGRDPHTLVLGARGFDVDVPWRSRLGNGLTRAAYRALVGQKLQDTQTGLRGVPRLLLLDLLHVRTNRYEFELDMLLLARTRHVPAREVPIRTIYEHGNPTSHFNPVLDSMRIYFVLLRFSTVSLLTALLDNVVFAAALMAGSSILGAQVSGRLVAIAFNYTVVRRHVFLSSQEHRRALPKYLLLVVGSGAISYVLLSTFVEAFGISIIAAKIAAETLLFIVNFLVQRDLVFRPRQPRRTATDWDTYYRAVPPTAKLTRRFTTHTLLGVMRRHLEAGNGRTPSAVEIGGANSCFAEDVLRAWPSIRYHVIDSNKFGLELFRRRFGANDRCSAELADVLDLRVARPADRQFDFVYSVGLIEHFDPAGTAEAIRAHFGLASSAGTVVLSYPTPTRLYRVARGALEAVGLWRFPDERPLKRDEILRAIPEPWVVVEERILWPLILTQHLMVFRKQQ